MSHIHSTEELLTVEKALLELSTRAARGESTADAARVVEEAKSTLDSFDGPHTTEAVRTMLVVSRLAKYLRCPALAETCLRTALNSLQICPNREQMAQVLIELGKLQHDGGRFADAIEKLREAHDINIELYGNDHEQSATTAELLGSSYSNSGNHEAGVPFFEFALAYRRSGGIDSEQLALVLRNLAMCYLAVDRIECASEVSDESMCIVERTEGPNAPEMARSLDTAALIAKRLPDGLSSAFELQERAASICSSFDYDFDCGVILANAAGTAFQIGQADRAIELLRLAVANKEVHQGNAHPSLLRSLTTLACFLAEQHDYLEAESIARRVHDTHIALYGAAHAKAQESLELLDKIRDELPREDGPVPIARHIAPTATIPSAVDALLDKQIDAFVLNRAREVYELEAEALDPEQHRDLLYPARESNDRTVFQDNSPVERPAILLDTDRMVDDVFIDPPFSGQGLPLSKYIGQIQQFLQLLMTPGAQRAHILISRTINEARRKYSTDQLSDFVIRLWTTRWLTGGHCAAKWLLTSRFESEAEFNRYAADTAALNDYASTVKATVLATKDRVKNLDEWFHEMYKIMPSVYAVWVLAQRNGTDDGDKQHRFFEEIMADFGGTLNLCVGRALSGEKRPLSQSYLFDFRSRSDADILKKIRYNYRSRTNLPKFWFETATSFIENGSRSDPPQSLDKFDLRRAASLFTTLFVEQGTFENWYT